MVPGIPRTYGYTPAPHNQPRWTVGQFLFRGGNPRIRVGSMTGGGVIYSRPYIGSGRPYIAPQVVPVSSLLGPGVLLSNPFTGVGLLGGDMGTSQF